VNTAGTRPGGHDGTAPTPAAGAAGGSDDAGGWPEPAKDTTRYATAPLCNRGGYNQPLMQSTMSVVPFMLLVGTVFGALGAAGAYIISYSEYRQRFLRPGQSANRMALDVAGMTFAFFVVASLVLGLLLGQVAK